MADAIPAPGADTGGLALADLLRDLGAYAATDPRDAGRRGDMATVVLTDALVVLRAEILAIRPDLDGPMVELALAMMNPPGA